LARAIVILSECPVPLEGTVEVPAQLIVLSLPSLIYIAIRSLRGHPMCASRSNVGWTLCKWSDVLWAVAVYAVVAVMALAAFKFIPEEMLAGSSAYSGWPLNLTSVLAVLLREAFYVALGEEVFFRGFLGGWLIRSLGFGWGNLVQAAVFLLPHLLLLNLGAGIWSIFIVQFAAGWLQGWLRHRSGSILPGWLVHTLSNISSAVSVMR